MSTATFETAVQYVASSSTPTSTEVKLRLYALYKVATVSNRPQSSRPGLLDFSGRAKWDAWDKLGRRDEFAGLEEGERRDRAERAYVDEARKLDFAAEGDERDPAAVELPVKKEQMVAVSTMGTDFVDEAPPSRLHELAIAGDAGALEAFLAGEGRGADINERDSYGYTPLHLATDRGHAPVVKVLLEAGADRALADEDGNTALDLARLAEHDDLVALLS
ncbi:hypothetical protein Rhopal_004095-T1 [Rhodotorula paludigena]|uniref:ACB domain-containing protein n=1 Tax=Rhodotorula paludigena TaxID=86838 RepID=A0AAV5GNI5_9BASI|nr:hypothetical protein Rhopal_004095-T1 [Rhodotorula paludigena]